MTHRQAKPFAATVVIGVFVVFAGSMLWAFSTMPPSGLLTMPPNETYETECGDCHQPFHPSLLSSDSWKLMLVELDKHFGENATISNDALVEITAYLTTYGGDKWDTEAANRFRIVDPKAPYQITATPYWIRKHEDVDPANFKLKKVGVQSNCGACHTDHYSGRFDDQKIKIPKE